MSKKPAVYRMFDADGVLIYIGYSTNVLRRIYSYTDFTWYRRIATVKIEHFKTKKEAQQAEKDAIFNESPLYNVSCQNPNRELPCTSS